jgi:hypothetical protein
MVVGWQPSQVTTPSGTPDSLTALTTVIVRDTASSRRSNGTGVTSGFCAYAASARLKSNGLGARNLAAVHEDLGRRERRERRLH